MNLVNCGEKCRFQNDGFCHLPVGACSSSEPLNDCCYFVSIETKEMKIQENGKNKQNFV